jgi:cytoskeletal protein RodZ
VYERFEGAEERMWVRNIIWFILLIGIVVFSIFLFLLVMDPIPDYRNGSTEQTIKAEQNQTASETEGETDADHGSLQESKHEQTGKEQAAQQEDGHSAAAEGEQTAGHGNGAATSSHEENNTQAAHGESQAVKETPSASNADGEVKVNNTWYQVGQGVGYLALLVTLVPYVLFSIIGRTGRTIFRRLGRSAPQTLSFLSQLAIAIAALHGGMMLRLTEQWDRHLLSGVWLFVFAVLFFLKASLYTPASPNGKNNVFSALTVVIMLLYVIHAIG